MVNLNDILNINKNLSVLSSYTDRFSLCLNEDYVISAGNKSVVLDNNFKDIFKRVFGFEYDELNVNNMVLDIINNIIDSLRYLRGYIIFNDVLSFLDLKLKKKLLKYLKEKNIRVINFTSNPEELLIYKYVVVIDAGDILYQGNVSDVLSHEAKLKSLGFALPFVFDLSLQLKSYGLINELYFNDKKLEDELWK